MTADNAPRIPVYIINATYWPLAGWVYYKYGRPSKPTTKARTKGETSTGSHCHSSGPARKDVDLSNNSSRGGSQPNTNQRTHGCHAGTSQPPNSERTASDGPQTSDLNTANNFSANADAEKADAGVGGKAMSHCHHHGSSRPMYATILVGVSHCGAGCVLGDIVGEWIVYGSKATLGGQMIWVELLVDYAFALAFGIVFQYFSIAPMSGEYGPKSIWRAAKADILSLTSFEVGAFGWMVAFQVGIWGYKLSMATWTYWWMMQVGMILGFLTAMPTNYWLISQGIKEPCA
ncbi:hypothetical protein M433DRAFT_310551 [Acidomyces richmondensis BFW]|nr:hypothetical protein M433DRAFT_310551 [Acidomyces richmondensis BFW]